MAATVMPGADITFESVYSQAANAITFAVTDSTGAQVLAPTGIGIANPGTGVYLYTWPVPDAQPEGDYTAVWSATVGGAPSVVTEAFTVALGAASGSWCTLADIPALTGQPAPGQDALTAAQGMLEALIHRVWRPDDALHRDYYWLSRACAWQAVYVQAHPELATMMDVQSLSQDGLSITFKGTAGATQLYSPIAMRFLDALYRGSNATIRLNSAFQKNRPLRTGFDPTPSVTWSRL